MLELITDYLKSFLFLSPKSIGILLANSSVKKFDEGELIRKGHEVDKYVSIVLKGYVRQYIISDREEEITNYIAFKGMLVGSPESLILEKPSIEYIESITKSYVVQFDHWKLEEIAKTNIELLKFKIHHMEKLVLHQQERIRFFSVLTPEQRFKYLLETRPDIIKEVSQKYLASYIGVTPVSYSRIKSRFINK